VLSVGVKLAIDEYDPTLSTVPNKVWKQMR
jgi:hypothetical protein